MRGFGESDGISLDEYLKQEQDDCLEVMDWLAAQPWCTGACGMIGISWGGFNGLQVAARRPPELKAVITLCSTDDRYADDIHAMGGCMLVDNLAWASAMFAIQGAPPDPALVGERWREMWLHRLENQPLLIANWLEHQRRDAYVEAWLGLRELDDIKCPIYAVGGWADGYSNAIPRLLAGLKVPRKGLVGPWAHRYPHFAEPGPRIGFLQECLRWWDQWLKGQDTGIMARADVPGLDAGHGAGADLLQGAARPLGGRAVLAEREHQGAAAVSQRGWSRPEARRGELPSSCVRRLASDIWRAIGAPTGTRPICPTISGRKTASRFASTAPS